MADVISKTGPEGEVFLSTKQLAKRLGRSEGTLARWRSEGNGPLFHKPEGSVSYALSDVDQWLRKGRRRSTSDKRKDDNTSM